MKISNFDLRDNPLQNFIINGNMDFAQRGTSFAAIANGSYSLDRWKYYKTGAMVHTISQDTDVPTFAQSGVLSNFSLRLNLTTPDTSVAAGDLALIMQIIEGSIWKQVAQRDSTLSFWVKATLPGTYSISLQNGGTDRYLIKEYTINAANTWEKKTVAIPASPSSGTWNYTNGNGVYLQWILAAGSNGFGTVGSWQTGNSYVSSNQVNGVNTGATDFRIAQVMLNVGTEAASFDLFGKTYDGELLACKRYYQRRNAGYPLGPAMHTNSGTGGTGIWPLEVEMRGSPTGASSGGSPLNIQRTTGNAAGAITNFSGSTETAMVINFSGTFAGSSGDAFLMYVASGGGSFLAADAEL